MVHLTHLIYLALIHLVLIHLVLIHLVLVHLILTHLILIHLVHLVLTHLVLTGHLVAHLTEIVAQLALVHLLLELLLLRRHLVLAGLLVHARRADLRWNRRYRVMRLHNALRTADVLLDVLWLLPASCCGFRRNRSLHTTTGSLAHLSLCAPLLAALRRRRRLVQTDAAVSMLLQRAARYSAASQLLIPLFAARVGRVCRVGEAGDRKGRAVLASTTGSRTTAKAAG